MDYEELTIDDLSDMAEQAESAVEVYIDAMAELAEEYYQNGLLMRDKSMISYADYVASSLADMIRSSGHFPLMGYEKWLVVQEETKQWFATAHNSTSYVIGQ